MKPDNIEYVDTPAGLVPVTSIWWVCSRCGEHVPITDLRPPIGDEDAPPICKACFELDINEALEALVANSGWTKKFENGEWYYYPPEEAGK